MNIRPLRHLVPSLVIALLACLALKAQPVVGPMFMLTSPAFINGGTLPARYTCDGLRASPPLKWSNPPTGTQFFAVTMHHIPSPGEKHVYLVIYNIPAAIRNLPENARNVGLFGINTVNGQQEDTPPCSKGPGPKLYTLTVYALSSAANFDVPASAVTMDLLLAAIKDKMLATSVMNVTYSRPGRDAPPNPTQDAGAGPDRPSGGVPGPRLPREVERALEGMTLTSDQKEKVDALVSNFKEKQRQLRDNLLSQLKGTLDPQQYAQIEEAFKQPPPQPNAALPRDAPRESEP